MGRVEISDFVMPRDVSGYVKFNGFKILIDPAVCNEVHAKPTVPVGGRRDVFDDRVYEWLIAGPVNNSFFVAGFVHFTSVSPLNVD